MGHLALSDFADKAADDPVFAAHKNCQFWTLDEAAILYSCARQFGGDALDIGGHTGWTARYLREAGCSRIACVDPMYSNFDFSGRMLKNIDTISGISLYPYTSDKFLRQTGSVFDVVVIDGNHDSPFPLNDAKNAVAHIKDSGLIMLHDFWGWPIQDAVTWLQQNGFNVKIYNTPNGVACCWRGDFTPPEHIPDHSIDWKSVWQSRVTKFAIA